MYIIENISGHVHLLVKGRVTKGLRSAGKRYINSNGTYIAPDKFGKTREYLDAVTKTSRIISFKIDDKWDWIDKNEVYTDLGHITHMDHFKIGDMPLERQITISKGVISLKHD